MVGRDDPAPESEPPVSHFCHDIMTTALATALIGKDVTALVRVSTTQKRYARALVVSVGVEYCGVLIEGGERALPVRHSHIVGLYDAAECEALNAGR